MIRVALVDDHAVVRAGLRQYLSEHVDLRVTAEASNGREALDIVRKELADVLLLDISMPDQSGVDALVAIKARAPNLPVLILSSFPEEHYATTLLRQGAAGYLGKDCDPEEIVKAIRTVALGRRYITSGIAERLAAGLAGGGDKPPHEQLSEREFQVFLRLAKGGTCRKSRPAKNGRSNANITMSCVAALSMAFCRRLKSGKPASFSTTISVSSQARSTPRASTASATGRSLSVQSWPLRVNRRTSSPSMRASRR